MGMQQLCTICRYYTWSLNLSTSSNVQNVAYLIKQTSFLCIFCFKLDNHTFHEKALTYLTYASWFLLEQRAATTPFQRTRFWLVLFNLAHVFPAAFISASMLLCQVCFGRPTLRFPCGFQSRACLVMLDAGFRCVWPIQPHLHFLISVSVGVCFVLSHSYSFETTSGHLMLRMFLRHLLVNVCSLWVLVLVTRNVSER